MNEFILYNDLTLINKSNNILIYPILLYYFFFIIE